MKVCAAFLAALAVVVPAKAQQFTPGRTPMFVMPAPSLDKYAPRENSHVTLPGPDAVADKPVTDPNADLAFGAFQRGFFATAMREALKRLDKNKHDGAAMTLVAVLYAQGLGIKPSKAEAANWFKLAAAAGDPQAMFELAMMKLKGDAGPVDKASAKNLFQQAAAHEHAGALYNLGIMALQNNGVVSDFKSAASYFTRSADLGDSQAEYALAIMYRNGQGVEADIPKSAELMKRAADDDNMAAIVEYAIMLFNGVGVEKDEAGAARYFLKGAARNNPVAQNRSARLLCAGRGVKQNVVEGLKWHILARSAGLKDEWLDSQLVALTPAQRKAVDEAVKAYIGS